MPQEYIHTTVTEGIDKAAAAKDLKGGIAIEGLALVTGKKKVVVQ